MSKFNRKNELKIWHFFNENKFEQIDLCRLSKTCYLFVEREVPSNSIHDKHRQMNNKRRE